MRFICLFICFFLAGICAVLPAQERTIRVKTTRFFPRKPLDSVYVFYINKQDNVKVRAKKPSNALGETALVIIDSAFNNSLEIGTRPYFKHKRFVLCQQRALYELRLKKDQYQIPENGLLTLRMHRKYAYYNYIDAGSVALSAVSLATRMKSDWWYDQYRTQNLKEQATTQSYEKANTLNRISIATFYAGLAAQLFRWVDFCVDCRRKNDHVGIFKPTLTPIATTNGVGIGLFYNF